MSSSNYPMYIHGKWCDAQDGNAYDDMNPYTGEVFARVAAGSRGDAKRAVDAAAEAFPRWSRTLPAERRKLLLKAADIMESRTDDIVSILGDETGCTFPFAMFQAGFSPGLFREAAGQVTQVQGEIIPSNNPGVTNLSVRQPVGVVAGIAPWNAPLILSLRAVCMPIAYGNTAVLKPSTESSVAGGILLGEIFHEAGFPPGVINVVTNGPGQSGDIGDEFVENPAVKRINLTGSSAVGRQLAEKAGRYLKRVALELGGQNPLIILRDADVELAVNAAVFGAFLHQGQICMSTRRLIVEAPILEAFKDRLLQKVSGLKVGNPREPDTIVGPLINRQQLNKIKESVAEALKEGAELLCGGTSEGLCFQPTVLANVKPGSPAACEEIFGPVVSIIAVHDEAEAVRVANDTPYGLSAGVITGDIAKGLNIADQVESGIFHINDQTVGDEPQVPFGGVKDSGFGRFGGTAALEEFTELRWISLNRTPPQYPF